MLKEFEAVAKRLEADFEEAQEYRHQGLKGLIREQAIVKNFLGRYLPKRYAIGSGQISDSGGKFSKQQDIVIYDGLNSPLLQDHEGAQLFFAEQVLTTLEVKSWLDKAGIDAVLENSNSVGQLDRRSGGPVTLAPGFKVRSISYPIVSFGVAYNSPLSLHRIRDEVYRYTSQASQSFWPTALLVLQDRNQQSGLIVTVDANNLRHILLFPKKDSRIASVSTPTKGVAMLHFFLLLLQRLELGGLASPSPDYLAYARQSGLSEFELSINNEALQGTRVEWEGKDVEVDNMTKIANLQAKLNSDTSISDQEIFDLYGTAIKLPNIDTGFRLGTVFVIDHMPWTEVTPEEVGVALDRMNSGGQLERDKEVLVVFTQMIRHIQTSASSLSIIDTQSGARLFLWVGPSLNGSGRSVQD